ncbi:MAG: hypothetical protein K2K67_09070 [Treponemataceae bacterium]|nr:hypothetical protein [Treponemataceae bacterium]
MSLVEELAGADRTALERRARTERARADFGFFCRTYLSDYFFEDAAEYQRLLYEVANGRALTDDLAERLRPFVREKYRPLLRPSPRLSGAMFIEPREHGKTVRWSFAYVLWCVLTGRARYVLLIGASGEAAAENLSNIKTEIEENEAIAADFGGLRGDVWTNRRMELANGTCVQCKGSGASMRGTRFRQFRPDLIVIDDVLKDDATNSFTQRNKIHRWLKRVVFNLGKSAFVIWVNTIFHNDDPISRLCRELEAGDLVNWIAVRLSCIREDGSPLWPEYWDKNSLDDKRRTIGAAAFSTEYMNEPLSDEERIIRPEWIAEHRYSELPPRSRLRFFLGVDPATGRHDGTAEVPVAQDTETGILYVLPSFADTCAEQRTVEQMVLLHRLYRFAAIAWEDVAFSGIYGNYIQKLGAEKGVYLPIVKVGTGGKSKEMRVRSYSMLVQNGFIRFPVRGCTNVETQLTEFPVGAFDDLCDALWLAVQAAERGGGKVQAVSSIRSQVRTLAKGIISKARRF